MQCLAPTNLSILFCAVDVKCSSEKLEHVSRICCPATLLFCLRLLILLLLLILKILHDLT